VAVAPDGSLVVADALSGGIARLGPEGGLLAVWSPTADEPGGRYTGCLNWRAWVVSCTIQPVAVAPTGDVVYRLDGANGRIQRYALDGTPLPPWYGIGASNVVGGTAQGVAVSPDDAVVVSDTPNGRVVRFGQDGLIAGVLDGARAARGTRAAFERPGGLAVGPDGTLYVADRERGRILAFGHGHIGAWRAEKYGNLDLVERPIDVESITDPVLDRDWGETSEPFSARFERTLDLGGQADAAWELEVAGGVRLWLGDALVVDAWHGAGGDWQGRIASGAGGTVPVRLELRAPVGPVRVRFALEGGSEPVVTAGPSPSAVPSSAPSSTPLPSPTLPRAGGPDGVAFVPYAAR